MDGVNVGSGAGGRPAPSAKLAAFLGGVDGGTGAADEVSSNVVASENSWVDGRLAGPDGFSSV